MKLNILKLCLAMFTALVVSACGPDAGSVDKDADAGRADFGVLVAVGDSLTAGYADGALYRQIQENSYPAILARQIAEAGGGEFLQPLMKAVATGSLTFMGGDLGRPDRLMLGATGDPDSPAAPETIKPTRSEAIDVPLMDAGGYHNFGVPGAKSFHLSLMGYGNPLALPNANPYFARFASIPAAAASMLGDASGLAPTFFILWIGGNDILLYALDGGASGAVYGTNTTDITDPALFTPSFDGAIATLKTPSNKGLVINIPDVATIPHFTTVPYDAIPLTKGEASDLNAQLSVAYELILNAAVGATLIDADERDRRLIDYKKGQNPILISDDSLTDLSAFIGGLPGALAGLVTLAQARPATSKDFILLATASKLGEEAVPGNALTKWGVTLPLEDADVLTRLEYNQVEVARKAYNKTIKAAADADDDILFYDAAARLAELNENGILYGSGGVTAEFATGGFFSLDGVHPTARGYAVIANEIMQVIEEGFGASLPPVNPGDFTTVFYQ